MNNILKRAGALDDRAVASLTLGVAGLFFFNLLFGPAAIVLGAFAAHRRRDHAPSRRAGLAGIALGVADLLVLAVLVAVQIHHGSLTWRL